MVMRHPKPRTKIAKALAFLLTINIKRGDIAEAARSFNVNRKSLTSAWSNLCQVREIYPLDSNDRAVLRALHLSEARGATTRRLLTDEQEEIVIRKLRTEYPQGFTENIIVNICRQLFHSLRNHPRLFSRHFLKRFKARAGIHSSKLRVYQRTHADLDATFEKDVDKALRYIDKVEELTKVFKPDRFINVDECPSYVRNLPTHALHFADSPAPWICVRAKERDCVSVIGAVTGDGRVLNTTVIAKGTTRRCEAMFRAELPTSFIQHTESGVTTSESFIEYLTHVILPYTNDEPAVLIADAYSAHVTPEVKQFCKDHHLTYVIVPDRATSVLQPLDVAVFGSAKFKIHQDVKNTLFEIDRDEFSRWQATAECVRDLNRVNIANGQRAWNDTFPFWPDHLKAHKLV